MVWTGCGTRPTCAPKPGRGRRAPGAALPRPGRVSALDAARGQPLDEVALEGEEERDHRDADEDGTRGEVAPGGAVLADVALQDDGEEAEIVGVGNVAQIPLESVNVEKHC